jgi:hypothetical protein
MFIEAIDLSMFRFQLKSFIIKLNLKRIVVHNMCYWYCHGTLHVLHLLPRYK